MFPRLMGFLTENWALKLAAVALALLLWLGVRANEPRRAEYRNVPVQVDLRDPEWRLAGPPVPSEVSVTVSGSMGSLMTLAGNPPRIVLPVDRVTDPTEVQVVPVHWIQFPAEVERGPGGITVLGLRPDTIRLRYERLETRTLPLQVRTRGSLPEGLALTAPINTTPAVVEVRGPGAQLEAMDSVPLVPVDLSGLRSTTNVPTAVDTSRLRGFTVVPAEVNVVLRVMRRDTVPDGVEGNPDASN
ncbi:MAG TPA: YbbR-like domain-containing protein [Longimicrobiales bacterium]|nr:YbbR-like domain-containing protein [Longimicrobiales bacterium]